MDHTVGFRAWSAAYDAGYTMGRDDCAEQYSRNVHAYAWANWPQNAEGFLAGYRNGWRGQEVYGSAREEVKA